MLISSIVLLTASRAVAQDSLKLKAGRMVIAGDNFWMLTPSLEYPVTPHLSAYVRVRPAAWAKSFAPEHTSNQFLIGGKMYMHWRKSAFPNKFSGYARGIYLMPFFSDQTFFRERYIYGVHTQSYYRYQYTVRKSSLGAQLGYQTWLGKGTRFSRSLFVDTGIGMMYHLKVSHAITAGEAGYLPPEAVPVASPIITFGGGIVLGQNPESQYVARKKEMQKEASWQVNRPHPIHPDSVFPTIPGNTLRAADIDIPREAYAHDKGEYLQRATTAADSALIQLFFKRRAEAWIAAIIGEIIIAPISAATSVPVAGGSSTNGNVTSSWSVGISPVGLPLNIALFGYWASTMSTYSRHNLFCYLNHMANLPPRIRNKLLKRMEKKGLLLQP